MIKFINKHWFYFLIIFYISLVCYFVTNTTFLSTSDFHNFKNTPVWDIAKATRENNPDKIRRLMATGNYDINYRDEEKGRTILYDAVANTYSGSWFGRTKNSTIEALLECGADPNIHEYTHSTKGVRIPGSNPVIEAAEYLNYEVMKMLLEHGGDPNSQNIPKLTDVDPYDHTALITAIRTYFGPNRDFDDNDPIEIVKLLVQAGADINKTTRVYRGGALEACIVHDKMETLYYLLNMGADYNVKIKSFRERDEKGKPKDKDILYGLRTLCYEIGSKKHIYKRRIINFLKKKGLDYDSTPIPQYVLESIKRDYPNSWEEYIKKY